MLRMLTIVGLLLGLGAGVTHAQTRVGVSLSFGDPHFSGQVVIGRPYYQRYVRPHYYRYYYRPAPIIVVTPRVLRPSRVILVRPHRHAVRRHHRH